MFWLYVMRVSYFVRIRVAPARRGIYSGLSCDAGLVWFGLVWFGLVWFGLVWFGLVWFGLVWFGLVWFACVFAGIRVMFCLVHALPLCGAALTFFAAAKKVSKESGLTPQALVTA
ncbi:hypothetical protein [Burkholderia sp. Ac-20365]|uniref:hypothetical protein n=1 Tax=Burkholderia sp. Ac-20365 TaxID=2703897 RepID=UPI00197C3EF2|nr:hypothetical protein [Burkholderia sp. Ac-20365]MBN3762962.1 hypothetical protein [Burkholderia sp. Ac-20365]